MEEIEREAPQSLIQTYLQRQQSRAGTVQGTQDRKIVECGCKSAFVSKLLTFKFFAFSLVFFLVIDSLKASMESQIAGDYWLRKYFLFQLRIRFLKARHLAVLIK